MRDIVRVFEGEFLRYKALGDATLAQLGDDDISRRPPGGGNSVAVIVRHVSGNLASRFTDFLTSDGEKPWRDRDLEFETHAMTVREAVETWERGWGSVTEALAALDDTRLADRITIRGQGLSVLQALARALAHTASHVGQIVFLGKMWKGDAWNCLSIPRGASRNGRRQSIQPPPTTTSPS